MTLLKAVRGTRDLLPPETELWNHVESTARRVFARYNFGEIRTPIFEDTALFARSVGEETDIVEKEMYTWDDGERFDKNLLIGRWNLANRERFGTVYDKSPSGTEPIDLECEDHDGNFEIVLFGAKPSLRSVQVIAS